MYWESQANVWSIARVKVRANSTWLRSIKIAFGDFGNPGNIPHRELSERYFCLQMSSDARP